MTREIHLGSLHIDRRGERITSDILIDLRAEKLQNIWHFCPFVSQLLHGTFCVDIYVLDGVVNMDFKLLENHQPQLYAALATDSEGRASMSNETGVRDSFFLEYEILHREIKNAPATLLVATTPVLTREELQVASPEGNKRRHLRKGTRVRGGAILDFPDLEGPTRLNVPLAPKLLPAGTRLSIVAIVKDLPPKRALLRVIRKVDRSPMASLGLSLPDQMLARRQIHGVGASMGAILLESRDHRMPIALEVVLLDSWIDGEHLMLDIVSASRLTSALLANKNVD